MEKLKKLFSAQDMTVGSPFRCLVLFSIPLLIGNLAQLLYSTVDSIVIGKYVGDAALAAIGISSPVLTLFIVIFMAIGSGVCVLVSQYYGAKEYELLERSIGNAVTLIAGASVFLTFFGILLASGILRLINTPEQSFEMAKSYLIICFIGIAGDGFYNIMSGVLRGMGDSVFPLLALLFCTVMNTVLDLLFVAVFHMGVAGAAWATSIAKTASAILCIVRVLRSRANIHMKWKHLRLDRHIVKNVCRLGIPSGISRGIIFFVSIVVQSCMNKMGVTVTAAVTAVTKVDAFAVIPSQTFGACSSTFTGQNMGAGKLDRIKKGSRLVLLMNLTLSSLMAAMILIIGRKMLGLFTDTDEVIRLGYRFIVLLTPSYLMLTAAETFGGVMRGAGDAISPMWTSLLANTLVRIPVMFLLLSLTTTAVWPAGNPDSSYIALDICIAVQASITLLLYRRGKWKNMSVINKK